MNGIDKFDRPADVGNRRMGWGSDVAAEMLRRLKFKYIALNPGASYRGLHDSLVNYLGNRDPQLLLCLHEDHAIAIAHGYAKASGEPMAAVVHSNVGLMHALMGIFNAWCDRLPVFVLGATGPADPALRRPWIDWIHTVKDQGALLRHFTKWDDEPRTAEALVESMMRANLIMRTAPRGPVYVCLDAGLQEAELEREVALPDPERFAIGAAPTAAPEVVARAAETLVGAHSPVILMGRLGLSEDGWKQRVRLAELLGARVITDLKTASVFPTNHALHVGVPAMSLGEAQREALRQADAVLGLNWVDLAGAFKQAGMRGGPTATVINCSIDAYLHNGWSMDHFGLPVSDVTVLADAEAFTAQLVAAVEARVRHPKPMPPSARPANARPANARAQGGARQADTIGIADVGRALGRARATRAITITRVPLGWDATAYDFTGPLDYLGYDGGGGLGSGPGNAIGAGLAFLGTARLPVAVLGDGDFLQGATALWTAAHYKIPVLFLIANNRSNYNDEIHQETVANRRRRPVENRWVGQRIEAPAVDLASLARSQGVAAAGPVERFADLAPALATALAAVAAGEPYLLDVVVERRSAAMIAPRGEG